MPLRKSKAMLMMPSMNLIKRKMKQKHQSKLININTKNNLNQSLGVTGKYSSSRLKNGGGKNKTKLQQTRRS